MKSAIVLLLIGYLAVVQSTHIVANFGNQVIESDFKFGDDEMVVDIHRPVNAPDNFRETTNLHVFSTNNGHFGTAKEARINLDGIKPLHQRTVRILLGTLIATFCEGHAVYLLTKKEVSELDSKDLGVKSREKRAVYAFIVAGHCVCPIQQ